MVWKIMSVILLAIVIAVFEVPNLLKNRLLKELLVFLILLVAGTGLGIARSMELELPSPLDLISFIYKPISDAIFQALQ